MSVILFVSAPFGGAFRVLASTLEQAGVRVLRIVRDGGELMATPKRNRVRWSAADGEWGEFIALVLARENVDMLVAYNDMLPHNARALEIARTRGIATRIFENGYLRPYWVTMEANGVNGTSHLPRDLRFYLKSTAVPAPTEQFRSQIRQHVMSTFWHHVCCYGLAPVVGFDATSYGDDVWVQAKGYMSEYAWRLTHSERAAMERVNASIGAKPTFLLILQKPGDAQLVAHSRYGANKPYLDDVFASFASHAPADALLLVKQHPLDWGKEDLAAHVADKAKDLGIADRVVYLRKTPVVADLLHRLSGAVTVNSTMGLAALEAGCAVKVLGNAIYDMAGLTDQQPLNTFWLAPEKPEPRALRAFTDYLRCHCQFNGGFHSAEARRLLAKTLGEALISRRIAPHDVACVHSLGRSKS